MLVCCYMVTMTMGAIKFMRSQNKVRHIHKVRIAINRVWIRNLEDNVVGVDETVF